MSKLPHYITGDSGDEQPDDDELIELVKEVVESAEVKSTAEVINHGIAFAKRYPEFKDYRGQTSPNCLDEVIGSILGLTALLGTDIEPIIFSLVFSFQATPDRSINHSIKKIREAIENAEA